MAASAAAVTLLPPVKCVVVYKNGDPFYNGRRFVVNQRHVTTMESFLTEVTESIGAPLAIRNLYTPRWGHKVTDLQDLQTGGLYVAAGFERFKKVDYLNSGMKKQQPAAREETQTRVIQRPNVSAKWRKFLPVPCIIHVFRNGDILCPPFRFIVPRSVQQDLEQILSMITEKVSLRTGAVRRLCSLEGVTVSSAGELKTGHCYVAVGTERFKKLPYVELLVSKATERHFLRKRRLLQQPENRKAESGPEDQYSDSAVLASPESDERRVKSTGHEDVEAAGQQATQQRTTRRGGGGGAPVLVSEMSPTSVFFTRPVQGHKNRHQPGPPGSYRAVWPSGFEQSTHRKQEQLGWAEEEKTAVVPPIDQRKAKIVDEEELNTTDKLLQSTEEMQLSEPDGIKPKTLRVNHSRTEHSVKVEDRFESTAGIQQPEVKQRSSPPTPHSSGDTGALHWEKPESQGENQESTSGLS